MPTREQLPCVFLGYLHELPGNGPLILTWPLTRHGASFGLHSQRTSKQKARRTQILRPRVPKNCERTNGYEPMFVNQFSVVIGLLTSAWVGLPCNIFSLFSRPPYRYQTGAAPENGWFCSWFPFEPTPKMVPYPRFLSGWARKVTTLVECQTKMAPQKACSPQTKPKSQEVSRKLPSHFIPALPSPDPVSEAKRASGLASKLGPNKKHFWWGGVSRVEVEKSSSQQVLLF